MPRKVKGKGKGKGKGKNGDKKAPPPPLVSLKQDALTETSKQFYTNQILVCIVYVGLGIDVLNW